MSSQPPPLVWFESIEQEQAQLLFDKANAAAAKSNKTLKSTKDAFEERLKQQVIKMHAEGKPVGNFI